MVTIVEIVILMIVEMVIVVIVELDGEARWWY